MQLILKLCLAPFGQKKMQFLEKKFKIFCTMACKAIPIAYLKIGPKMVLLRTAMHKKELQLSLYSQECQKNIIENPLQL